MRKTINILITFLIVINSFTMFINNVSAVSITATVNDSEGVYIRSGPGTNYSKVTLLSNKTTITLVDKTLHEGTGCKGWYQINYSNSTDRYICSELVIINDTSKTGNYYTTSSFDTRIIEDYANVRKSPNGIVIEKIFLGTEVTVLSSSGNWYKISYYNGKTGYILKKLCKNYSEITLVDTEYYKELEKEGFPKSYWPFLSYLHSIHPAWIFKADRTNKDFSTAVTKETGQNYIPSTIDAFRINSVAKEGIYYTATSGVVAVYLDPRNYLNEANIFAFEALSYNEKTQTANILKNIFANTYLNTDNYINTFMTAGKTYNISPVHLAIRVKQEGGTDENYGSVSGKSGLFYNEKTLNEFYNYYNIGAYGSNTVTSGLAIAAGYVKYDGVEGTPWNSREKAITYGAKWIADGYINKGQDTIYYQKFNTKYGATYNAYIHQYMTNILAPASESLSTYGSYIDSGLLETAYTFYIPVYNNIPNDYTIMPPIGDTNNNLSDLKVNNTTIVGFDSDVIEYTSYVPYDATSVEISATLSSSDASIIGTGTIDFKENKKIISVIVTSQTNDTKTYTITIIRQEKSTEENGETILTPTEIVDKMDVKFSDTYMTYIPIGTTATTLINEAKEKEATATITITNSSGITKTNENLVTGDIINITSNNVTKTFTIAIKGDVNGDGIINSLDSGRILRHILKYSTLVESSLAAADTNYDGIINSIDSGYTLRHILGYSKLR